MLGEPYRSVFLVPMWVYGLSVNCGDVPLSTTTSAPLAWYGKNRQKVDVDWEICHYIFTHTPNKRQAPKTWTEPKVSRRPSLELLSPSKAFK